MPDLYFLPESKSTYSLWTENISPSHINSSLGKTLVISTIFRWINVLTTGNVSANPIPGGPRSVCSRALIGKINSVLGTNQKVKSARPLANEIGCGLKTVHIIIRDDLSQLACKKIIIVCTNKGLYTSTFTIFSVGKKN
jgi:hypothetical protein